MISCFDLFNEDPSPFGDLCCRVLKLFGWRVLPETLQRPATGCASAPDFILAQSTRLNDISSILLLFEHIFDITGMMTTRTTTTPTTSTPSTPSPTAAIWWIRPG